MGKDSKIQWTEDTWNPWHGCKKVSAGCKYCYMYRDKERYGQDPTTVMRSKTKFNAPLKMKEGKLIFTCSWSDWFIEEADEWRAEAWEIIRKTPQHTYQILTKRPERILDCLPADWGNGYPNVWLGFSAENNDTYIDRIDHFQHVPAAVKFISFEPLLDRITNFELEIVFGSDSTDVDWVIIGGESGNETGKYRYRPVELAHIQELTDDCVRYKIPVFVKQLGTYQAKELKLKDRHGGNMDEWPESLQVRQFPETQPVIT